MPEIDVSGVLSDPGFQDTFTVVTAMNVINSGGMQITTDAPPVVAYGVVYPAKGGLQRLPDGSRLSASIEILTQFPLQNGVKIDETHSRAPDTVRWRGRDYLVVSVNSWADYGAGYFHVALDMLDFNPTAAP